MKSLLLSLSRHLRFILLTSAAVLVLGPGSVPAAERTVLGELYSSDF